MFCETTKSAGATASKYEAASNVLPLVLFKKMETGPGGTAVHLGDHCVIAFTPLPFPVCRLGKWEANGDLFKHMRDPPQSGDGKDAP